MIDYFKKLFSGQYKHIYEPHQVPWDRGEYSPPYLFKCKKCNQWKRFWLPELDLCSMSENEYIIKQILE